MECFEGVLIVFKVFPECSKGVGCFISLLMCFKSVSRMLQKCFKCNECSKSGLKVLENFSDDSKEILEEVCSDRDEIIEKVSNDVRDILEKLSNDGDKIFKKAFDDDKDILEDVYNDADNILDKLFG